MFRQKSLQRLSSPERLDELTRIVRRRSWILLLGIGCIVAAVVAWSILGRIPVTTQGIGVLAHPRLVVPFQAPYSGRLRAIDVAVGDHFTKGQVLGRLHLPDLQKQLEHEEQRLEAFRSRSGKLTDFDREQARQERAFLAEQRRLLQARIDSLRQTADSMLETTLAYLAQQRENLDTTKTLSEKLDKALKERLESHEALKREGLSSADIVVDARRRWFEIQLRLAELAVELQSVQLREVQAREDHARRMDLVADLRVQLQALDVKDYEIRTRLETGDLSNESERGEIERRIARLQSQLASRGELKAEHAGSILEITVSAGSIVQAGQRIGSLLKDDPDSELVALTYFPIGDGKKIRSGLDARVSPTTVARERFGTMRGSVQTVSAYPVTTDAAASKIGNHELALALTGGGSRIEVTTLLARDAGTPSGFSWTSSRGPDLPITAGTTVSVRVTIERKAPITLVIPALRAWFGLE